MPPEVTPPQPLARALENGLCRYLHLSALFTIPPAAGGVPSVYLNLTADELTGMTFSFPAINQLRLLIAPPTKDYIWKTFSLSWGEMSPAGTSTSVIITHGQYGMVLHEDPWIHSLVDYTYPHSLTLMRGKPEILVIENNEALAQTMDISIHIMAFHTKEDWDKYQEMLREVEKMTELQQARVDIQKDMLVELKRIGNRRVDC